MIVGLKENAKRTTTFQEFLSTFTSRPTHRLSGGSGVNSVPPVPLAKASLTAIPRREDAGTIAALRRLSGCVPALGRLGACGDASWGAGEGWFMEMFPGPFRHLASEVLSDLVTAVLVALAAVIATRLLDRIWDAL
jgi:hypothetical protein